MRIGVLFPQFEIGADPAAVRDFAQAADELGYAHLTAFDQIVGLNKASRPDWRYVHDAADMFHELFVLFGYLAALTERIELVTGVLVLPMRGTALVAKQAAEVDLLSGGRLRLGVGVGVKPEEFEACGEDFRNRGARTDEQIEAAAAAVDQRADHLRGPLSPDRGRRHQSLAGPAADPGLDRRDLGGGDATRGAPGRRLAAELRCGRLRPRLHREDARLRPGARPRSGGDRHRGDGHDHRSHAGAARRRAAPLGGLGATHATLNTMPERWVASEGRWNKAAIGGLADPQAHIAAIRRIRDALPELF